MPGKRPITIPVGLLTRLLGRPRRASGCHFPQRIPARRTATADRDLPGGSSQQGVPHLADCARRPYPQVRRRTGLPNGPRVTCDRHCHRQASMAPNVTTGTQAVTDQPEEYGFAYGTLPAHPEQGEEAFHVARRSGRLVFTVTAFSRPRHPAARLGGPPPATCSSARTGPTCAPCAASPRPSRADSQPGRTTRSASPGTATTATPEAISPIVQEWLTCMPPLPRSVDGVSPACQPTACRPQVSTHSTPESVR